MKEKDSSQLPEDEDSVPAEIGSLALESSLTDSTAKPPPFDPEETYGILIEL